MATLVGTASSVRTTAVLGVPSTLVSSGALSRARRSAAEAAAIARRAPRM
jgi:hypothetical protein